jgi:hypothetical protein
MNKQIPDNIIVNGLVKGLTEKQIGIHRDEITLRIDDSVTFLPRILVDAGLFKSTSEIRQINKQRLASTKFKDPLEQVLWRELDQPEMTRFKVGKKVFWLIVGEL